MRMHNEEGSDADKPVENGEPMDLGASETPEVTVGKKYRELRSRLKYLIYEHRCFESELSKAQRRLIELSQDKTVLLDQLLQYEPMSGEEEEVTDYSTSEDESGNSRMHRPAHPKQPPRDASGKSLKSNNPSSPSPVGGAHAGATKPSQITKQGIAKATAIINSVTNSNSVTSKVPKIGTKRQAKQTSKWSSGGGGGTAVKISKTVSRVRQNNAEDGSSPSSSSSSVLPDGPGVALGVTDNPKLVVSYPITSISATDPSSSSSSSSSSGLITTTLSVSTLSPHASPLTQLATTVTSGSIAGKPVSSRPVPALTKTQPLLTSTTSSSSSSMHAGSVTVSSTPGSTGIPPALIPDTGKGRGQRNRSPSTTSSSGSSSSSDSGSDLSSGSEDEAMELGKGPVQIVSTVKNTSKLPRPKAIMSPVKMAPPLLMKVGGASVPPTPPPAVMSPQPAFMGWGQPPQTTGEGSSPLMGMEMGGSGFTPIASPLTSPSMALPFSSLNNPGGSASAFQVFSPKHSVPPSTQTGLPQPISSSAATRMTVTKPVKAEATPHKSTANS